jgi:hypothetical protein
MNVVDRSQAIKKVALDDQQRSPSWISFKPLEEAFWVFERRKPLISKSLGRIWTQDYTIGQRLPRPAAGLIFPHSP